MEVYVALEQDQHVVEVSLEADIAELKAAIASKLSLKGRLVELCVSGEVQDEATRLRDLVWSPTDPIEARLHGEQWARNELISSEGIVGRYHDNLVRACGEGNMHKVKLLMDTGAALSGHCLLEAVENNQMEVAELLLERGVTLEQKNSTGTPLVCAAFRGFEDMARLLLDGGADINARKADRHSTHPKDWTALMSAAYNGHTDLTEMLGERGASLELVDAYNRTALGLAAMQGHEECVRYLLSKGASPGHIARTSQTPVSYAARRGYIGIVSALAEAGADLDHKTSDGETALMQACSNGRTETVQCLVSHKASMDARNKDLETPLVIAVSHGRLPCVRALISGGVDLNARCGGKTPATIAQNKGRDAVLRLLLENGASFGSPPAPTPPTQEVAPAASSTANDVPDKAAVDETSPRCHSPGCCCS